MTQPTLIITDSNGNTKATLECDTAQATTAHREMDRAEAVVARNDFGGVSIDSRTDRLELERPDGTTLFGGRFDDSEPTGNGVRVTIVSYRRDAIDAEPTGRSKTYQNVADDTVITDVINAVSTLSQGSVANLASGLSFEFPHASRSKQLQKVGIATGGVFRFNDDRTVDYADRFGSDRSLTIAPSNQNVTGEITVQRDTRDEVTHVRAFGSREGNLTRDAVASSYSSGRKVWREYEDTDIRDPSRLQTIADRLVSEYDGEPRKLVVEATLIDVDVQRGDSVVVDLPKRDLNERLIIKRLVERFSAQGHTYQTTLTNRLVDDDAEGQSREALQRFNRGYQGFVDRNQTTSGWNAAGDGTPQTLEIPAWPDDIVREDQVTLTVQGRAWRSPVSASGHTHDVTVNHPSHSHDVTHPSHSHDVPINVTSDAEQDGNAGQEITQDAGITTVDGTWTTVDSRAYLNTDPWKVAAYVSARADGGASLAGIAMRLDNPDSGTSTGKTYFKAPNSGGTEGTAYAELPTGAINPDDTIKIQLISDGLTKDIDVYYRMFWVDPHKHAISATETSDAALGTNETSTTALGTSETATSSSTTDFSPEVITTFNSTSYWPTDVEIDVNGSTVTTLSGNNSADWQTDVDLSGQLTAGQNTITATPTSQRGSLNLILTSELFRKGA